MPPTLLINLGLGLVATHGWLVMLPLICFQFAYNTKQIVVLHNLFMKTRLYQPWFSMSETFLRSPVLNVIFAIVIGGFL